jgi:uncharacterized protein YndB with AHSA1/START domain
MRLERFEAKTSGSYRYIFQDKDGNEFGFRGVCHEVVPSERIIQTFEFEGLPKKGHVALETMRFESLADHRTRLIVQSVFQSVVDRDGMIASGMERGVIESHERLSELLEELKTGLLS